MVAHADRGWIYNRLEQYRLAVTDLTYAIDHGYRQPWSHLLLADSLAAEGDIDQALTINNEVYSLGEAQSIPEAFFQRGGFLLLAKQFVKAQSFYEKGISVARKLGMRNILSKTIDDMNAELAVNVDIRKPGEDILQLLKEAQKQVQPNSKYDKISCERRSLESTEDEKVSGSISDMSRKGKD